MADILQQKEGVASLVAFHRILIGLQQSSSIDKWLVLAKPNTSPTICQPSCCPRPSTCNQDPCSLIGADELMWEMLHAELRLFARVSFCWTVVPSCHTLRRRSLTSTLHSATPAFLSCFTSRLARSSMPHLQ